MRYAKQKQNSFSKTLVLFLAVCLLLPFVVPGILRLQAASAQQDKAAPGNASTTPQAASGSTTSNVPQATSSIATLDIPRIIAGTSTIPDLSRVDWDKTINISGEQMALNANGALQALSNVPDDIKKLVSQYQADAAAIDRKSSLSSSEKADKKLHAKQALQHLIAKNLIAKGQLPANYFKLEANNAIQSADRIVDVRKASIQRLNAAYGKGVKGISDVNVLSATTATVITSGGGAPSGNASSTTVSPDASSSSTSSSK